MSHKQFYKFLDSRNCQKYKLIKCPSSYWLRWNIAILSLFCIEYKFLSFLCLKCLCYPAQFSVEYFRHRGPQEAWYKQINPTLCVDADCIYTFFFASVPQILSVSHNITAQKAHCPSPFPKHIGWPDTLQPCSLVKSLLQRQEDLDLNMSSVLFQPFDLEQVT